MSDGTNNQHAHSRLERLPTEILLLICQESHIKDSLALSHTCKTLHSKYVANQRPILRQYIADTLDPAIIPNAIRHILAKNGAAWSDSLTSSKYGFERLSTPLLHQLASLVGNIERLSAFFHEEGWHRMVNRFLNHATLTNIPYLPAMKLVDRGWRASNVSTAHPWQIKVSAQEALRLKSAERSRWQRAMLIFEEAALQARASPGQTVKGMLLKAPFCYGSWDETDQLEGIETHVKIEYCHVLHGLWLQLAPRERPPPPTSSNDPRISRTVGFVDDLSTRGILPLCALVSAPASERLALLRQFGPAFQAEWKAFGFVYWNAGKYSYPDRFSRKFWEPDRTINYLDMFV